MASFKWVLNSIQEVLGIREDKPKTFLGDSINTNALSNNEAQLISTPLNNIYSKVNSDAVNITFEKREWDSWIYFDKNDPYFNQVAPDLSSIDYSGFSGAYDLKITPKTLDTTTVEWFQANISKNYQKQFPELSPSEIQRFVNAEWQLADLERLWVSSERAKQIVQNKLEEEGTISNTVTNIASGFSSTIFGWLWETLDLVNRKLDSEKIKSLADTLEEISVVNRTVNTSVGAAIWEWTWGLLWFLTPSKAIQVWTKAAVWLWASWRVAWKVWGAANATVLGWLVVAPSLEQNIFKPIDAGEDPRIAAAIIDATALSFNGIVSKLAPTNAIKKLFINNPKTAAVAESIVFDWSNALIYPELTWQQNVGNFVTGLWFNYVSAWSLNASNIKKLTELQADVEILASRPDSQWKKASELIEGTDLENKYSEIFWGSNLLKVVKEYEEWKRSIYHYDAIEAISGVTKTQPARKALELSLKRSDLGLDVNIPKWQLDALDAVFRNQENKSVKLSDITNIIWNISDTPVIEKDSIKEQQIIALDERRETVFSEWRREKLANLALIPKSERTDEQQSEYRSLISKKTQAQKIEEEILLIADETSAENIDTVQATISSVTSPADRKALTRNLNDSAIAIVDHFEIPMTFREQEQLARTNNNLNEYVVRNEGIYNKIEDWNDIVFKPKISQVGEIRIPKNQYEEAKRQKRINTNNEYKKHFSKVRSEINSAVKDEILQLPLSAKERTKRVREIKVKTYEKIKKNWVASMSRTLSSKYFPIAEVKKVLNNVPYKNIDSEEKLFNWLQDTQDKALKSIDKALKKQVVDIEKTIDIKNKRTDELFKRLSFNYAKKNRGNIKKIASLMWQEEAEVKLLVDTHLANTIDFYKKWDKSISDYQQILQSGTQIANLVKYYDDFKKNAVAKNNEEYSEVASDIVDNMAITKLPSLPSKLLDRLDTVTSVLSNWGKWWRELLTKLTKANSEHVGELQEIGTIMTKFEWQLQKYGMKFSDYYALMLFNRSKKLNDTRSKKIDDWDNIINENGTSANNLWIDRQWNVQSAEWRSAEHVSEALSSGWRPMSENAMEKLDARYKKYMDDDWDWVNSISKLSSSIQDFWQKLYVKNQLNTLATGWEMVPWEYWFYAPFKVKTERVDTIENSSGNFDFNGNPPGFQSNSIVARKGIGKEWTMRLDLNDYMYEANNQSFYGNFQPLYWVLIPKIIRRLNNNPKFKWENRQAQYLKDMIDGIGESRKSRSTLEVKTWGKIQLLGYIHALGIHPTQLLTQKFTYASMLATNPDLIFEIGKNILTGTWVINQYGKWRVSKAAAEREEQSFAISPYETLWTRSKSLISTIWLSFSASADAAVTANILNATYTKTGRTLFKKNGIKYNAGRLQEFMYWGNDLWLDTKKADSIREQIIAEGEHQVTYQMISQNAFNRSLFENKHPLAAMFSFFLKRTAVKEATRIFSLITNSATSRWKNKVVHTAQGALWLAMLAGISTISKELAIGYSILSEDEAEVSNEDYWNLGALKKSSILRDESLLYNFFMRAYVDEEDREEYDKNLSLYKATFDSIKWVVATMPWWTLITWKEEFWKNPLQSFKDAAAFYIESEDEANKGSQFQETLWLALPKILKPVWYVLRNNARLNREFNNDLKDLGEWETLTYEEFLWGEVTKQLTKSYRERTESNLATITDLLFTDPVRYIQKSAEIYPTMTVKELAREAADRILDEWLLDINPEDWKVLWNENLQTFLLYSKEANRRDSTVADQLKRYTLPDTTSRSLPIPVYFEKYIKRKSKDDAIKEIWEDYKLGAISEDKATSYMKYIPTYFK